jgi:hypothetical protein
MVDNGPPSPSRHAAGNGALVIGFGPRVENARPGGRGNGVGHQQCQKVGLNMFAIINTVDTIEGFAKRGVYTFETRALALSFAVLCIREIDPAQNDDERKEWEVLLDFQDGLGPTEFFHIEKVVFESRTAKPPTSATSVAPPRKR